MWNFPMQGRLAMLVEEEARITPTMQESRLLAKMVHMQKLTKEMSEVMEKLVECMQGFNTIDQGQFSQSE
jgi:hypothetical protein